MKTIRVIQTLQTVAILGALVGGYFNYCAVGIVNDRINILNERIELIDSALLNKPPTPKVVAPIVSLATGPTQIAIKYHWEGPKTKALGRLEWYYVRDDTQVVAYDILQFDRGDGYKVFEGGADVCGAGGGAGVKTLKDAKALVEYHAQNHTCP